MTAPTTQEARAERGRAIAQQLAPELDRALQLLSEYEISSHEHLARYYSAALLAELTTEQRGAIASFLAGYISSKVDEYAEQLDEEEPMLEGMTALIATLSADR